MNHPMSAEDMSLLVRALYRDVTELDERLRHVEATVRELQRERQPVDLRPADVRS